MRTENRGRCAHVFFLYCQKRSASAVMCLLFFQKMRMKKSVKLGQISILIYRFFHTTNRQNRPSMKQTLSGYLERTSGFWPAQKSQQEDVHASQRLLCIESGQNKVDVLQRSPAICNGSSSSPSIWQYKYRPTQLLLFFTFSHPHITYLFLKHDQDWAMLSPVSKRCVRKMHAPPCSAKNRSSGQSMAFSRWQRRLSRLLCLPVRIARNTFHNGGIRVPTIWLNLFSRCHSADLLQSRQVLRHELRCMVL